LAFFRPVSRVILQIARQLRTQYIEGIHRPKYYKGHSRSLETESFDRSYTTYY